jgi:hypothetical protein
MSTQGELILRQGSKAMDGMIKVSIPVEPEVAAALDSPQKREAVGRTVSRMVRRRGEADPLITAMERLSAEAARLGLTQEIIDQQQFF